MNKGTVLIIDDEDIVRVSCRRILVPEGYEVETTKSASEGFEILAAGGIDIVLTDLKMPDIDGMQVLKKIKEEWPATEVIMITGYQTINTAVEAIKLGAFDYIEKPFVPGTIVEAIDKALVKRREKNKVS